MSQREQGHTIPLKGESVNDACRRLNAEGWNVIQLLVYVGPDGTLRRELLVEKAD